MKSYTDIEQSKKLAEILPIETADMDYIPVVNIDGEYSITVNIWDNDHIIDEGWIHCWSLASLLGVLPLVDFTMPQLIGTPKTLYRCMYNNDLKSHSYDNPLDGCVEMVIKLHELNLL